MDTYFLCEFGKRNRFTLTLGNRWLKYKFISVLVGLKNISPVIFANIDIVN